MCIHVYIYIYIGMTYIHMAGIMFTLHKVTYAAMN